MIIQLQNHLDAPAVDLRAAGLKAADKGVFSGTAHRDVDTQGENRLQGGTSTGINIDANVHAAVRMHVSPVFGNFWAYCPKTKTSHFQPRKFAT